MNLILDLSGLISDQSGHPSPEWFGESILPVSRRWNATLLMEEMTQNGREGAEGHQSIVWDEMLSDAGKWN